MQRFISAHPVFSTNLQGNPRLMEIVLKVNGVDVSQVVLDARTSSEANTGTIVSRMEAILQSDPEALKYLDLRGRVTLKVVQDGEQHPAFGGIVNFAQLDDSTYLLKCRDETQLLEEAKAGGGFGRGLLPAEIIYYIVAEVTPGGIDPRNFGIEGGTLADTGFFSRPRRFVYIAPLPSCALKSGVGTIKMVNSWLYTVADNASADDQVIAGYEADAELWQKSETRVRFYIQATNFLEALEKGRVRLQRLLDVLSFGANYASPTFPTDSGLRLFTYDRSRSLVDVQETEWAFIRDTTAADRYWMHWSAPHRHREPFSIARQDPISSLYEIFQEITEEDEEGLSGKQRALLNALHALRQVRQSADSKDSLDHVWRCMEFLLAGYATDPLFSDVERKTILNAAKKALEELESGDAQRIEKQKQRLQDVINQQLNQTPLRTKWRFFCNAHLLNFPQEDDAFLWQLRRNRNDHQHGRSTTVSRWDIDRAATIMEKALVAAVVKSQTEVGSE
jgi:hypothetical protein